MQFEIGKKKKGVIPCRWLVHDIGTDKVFFLSDLFTHIGRDLEQKIRCPRAFVS